MEKHKLSIDCMFEEGEWPIVEMYSKGHQPEKEFKELCKLVYTEECEENGEDIPTDWQFIDEAETYFKWGKVVGTFEDNKRTGWNLSESKEHRKGYFPITKINL